MGLALEVGILAQLRGVDEDGFDYYRQQFEQINRVLKDAGLPQHHEPRDVADGQTFSCEMFGYSGLHYLRRLAAYVADGKELPPPGDREAPKDPLLKKYYSIFSGQVGAGVPFQHLINHSDAEGYYLPVAFEDVIVPAPESGIAGGMVGSSQALLAECKRLAELLELPTNLSVEDDIVWEASDSQGEGETLWERYGVESYTCLALIQACEASVNSGAAIVFS